MTIQTSPWILPAAELLEGLLCVSAGRMAPQARAQALLEETFRQTAAEIRHPRRVPVASSA